MRSFQVYSDRLKEQNRPQHKLEPKLKTLDHAWNYTDWLELCQTEDENTIGKPYQLSPGGYPPLETSTTHSSQEHHLPSLNSVLRFNIKELNNHAQSFCALLQKFLPKDEPDLIWDHTPEFLAADDLITWSEELDNDRRLEDV